jgi:predicted RNase H-like HicB family nuclease
MSTAHDATTDQHVYDPPTVVEVQVTVQALVFREADGGYSVVVPELPGCVSQGETTEEAASNIAEAAGGWLAAQHDYYREKAIRDITEPLS